MKNRVYESLTTVFSVLVVGHEDSFVTVYSSFTSFSCVLLRLIASCYENSSANRENRRTRIEQIGDL